MFLQALNSIQINRLNRVKRLSSYDVPPTCTYTSNGFGKKGIGCPVVLKGKERFLSNRLNRGVLFAVLLEHVCKTQVEKKKQIQNDSNLTPCDSLISAEDVALN